MTVSDRDTPCAMVTRSIAFRQHTPRWTARSCARFFPALSALLALPVLVTAQPGPPPESHFEKVILNANPGEPTDLAVLPDGRVLHTTRTGQVWLHDPQTGRNRVAAELEVYSHDEEGLLSIALAPDFNRNGWVYIYYSPPLDTPVDDPMTPAEEGDAPVFGTETDWQRFRGVTRLSRFRFAGHRLITATEQTIIEVSQDRGICCHVGGDIAFDSAGNLILSTGDDTNSFQSDGYTPIDERPGRNPAFDAQRTSANTNDLRGKILRIRPLPSGGYAIPAGNLFPPGTPQTRPEIYAMGLVNPFRIAVNRQTDEIYVADNGPDALNPDPLRGPEGHGKWFVLREPGNYGWPYCATAALPYHDYDFETGASGPAFDCSAPVNESPNNTGRRELPAVQQPDVYYSYGLSAEFPELGAGGIAPMAGPAYAFDPGKSSPPAWPAYYDGIPLFYEWTRDYIKAFHLDAAGHLAAIEDVLPLLASPTLDNGMDLEFGPEGALYTLEYGDGFFLENPDARLARIDYIGADGNHAPVVQISADPAAGPRPLTVSFSSAGTSDPDGDAFTYEWYLDDNDDVDSTEPNPVFTYRSAGVYLATLNVTDAHGRSASKDVTVHVGE